MNPRRHIALSLLVLALTWSAAALAAQATRYGAGVDLDKATPVADLLAHPERYDGKIVRVDGVITAVCKKRGCWIQVSDPDTGKGIRIKVEDGVIVFPLESMGHRASAQGTFEIVHLSPEQMKAMAEHRAEEHRGEHGAEKEACQAEPVGKTVLLIRGTGAVIY